jgi:hypothetical protein
MREVPWGKLAALAGVVFAVAFVVGMLATQADVMGDDPDDEVLEWWSDSGNQTTLLIGGYLLAFAGVAFVFFMAHIRGRIATAEGTASVLASVAFGGALLFVGLLLAGMVFWISPAGAEKLGDTPLPQDADILRQLPQVGFGIVLIGGAWSAALALAATSWAVLRTGVLARWLAWLGFVCALLLLFGVFFIPMLALPIWVLAASVELWRRPATMAGA